MIEIYVRSRKRVKLHRLPSVWNNQISLSAARRAAANATD